MGTAKGNQGGICFLGNVPEEIKFRVAFRVASWDNVPYKTIKYYKKVSNIAACYDIKNG